MKGQQKKTVEKGGRNRCEKKMVCIIQENRETRGIILLQGASSFKLRIPQFH